MNGLRTGSLVILVAAALLVLVAGYFMLSVLGGSFGSLISALSVLVFGAAVLGLVVSFGLYRRTRSVS